MAVPADGSTRCTAMAYGATSLDIARPCGPCASERRLRSTCMPTVPDGAFGSSSPSMLAVNSGLEAFDIDACCRRRRLSPASARQEDGALHGRAFFDYIYHARRYAELLGRPVLSPQRVQRSLLEGYPNALHTSCQGDDIDEDVVSTSASREQMPPAVLSGAAGA